MASISVHNVSKVTALVQHYSKPTNTDAFTTLDFVAEADDERIEFYLFLKGDHAVVAGLLDSLMVELHTARLDALRRVSDEEAENDGMAADFEMQTADEEQVAADRAEVNAAEAALS